LDIGRRDNREKAARVTAEAGNVAAAIRIALRMDDPEPAFAAVVALAEFSRFARVFHQASGIDLSTLVEQSLAVAQGRSDLRREADLVRAQGDNAFDRWARETAMGRYARARTLYERLDATEGVAFCIHGLGEIAYRSADREAAQRYFKEGLELARGCGSAPAEGRCLVGLAELSRRTAAEDDASINWFGEARGVFQRIPDLHGIARCVHGLGDLTMTKSEAARREGKTDEATRHLAAALRYYQEALPLFEAMGGTLGVAASHRMFGVVALRRGEHDEAERRFREALTRFRDVESVRGQANCLSDLGFLALKRNDLDSALSLYTESHFATQRMPETWEAGIALRGLGEVSQGLNRIEDARRYFTQAVEIFTGLNDHEQVSSCNERLVQIRQVSDRAPAPTGS
jgi:tetratricopeptide (TPR) repeat protein